MGSQILKSRDNIQTAYSGAKPGRRSDTKFTAWESKNKLETDRKLYRVCHSTGSKELSRKGSGTLEYDAQSAYSAAYFELGSGYVPK